MEKVTVKAEPRKKTGSKMSRRVRKEGRLPAIIYGHGEPPEAVTLAEHEVEVALAHGARTLDLELHGTTKPYLIKEVQYDHLATAPVHIDLARVDLTERVRVRVGIELKGTPKGASEGGIIDQHLNFIEVECVVTEIPDTLHPSVANLALGDSLYVRDLNLPSNVTPVAKPDDRVATVRLHIVQELAPVAAAPAEGEAAAGAEPERIGRVRKDEEGEAKEEKK
jgi:large subunit ribosomal protein L25